jgi:hypothetical protein
VCPERPVGDIAGVASGLGVAVVRPTIGAYRPGEAGPFGGDDQDVTTSPRSSGPEPPYGTVAATGPGDPQGGHRPTGGLPGGEGSTRDGSFFAAPTLAIRTPPQAVAGRTVAQAVRRRERRPHLRASRGARDAMSAHETSDLLSLLFGDSRDREASDDHVAVNDAAPE